MNTPSCWLRPTDWASRAEIVYFLCEPFRIRDVDTLEGVR